MKAVVPTAELSDPGPDRKLVIGLVNNAAYGALQSTESRFLRLLCSAQLHVSHVGVRLQRFRCPELAPPLRGDGSADQRYSDVSEVFHTRPDALIVTGMEPSEAALENEPIWTNLARLADWAEDEAIPTIWSCLAAHAAVLHLDGVSRSRLPEKLSGVFECENTAAGQALMHGISSRLASPHSRHYDLSKKQLTDHGYQVLSESSEAGVDIFLKRRPALFLFLQGHPEYDPDTLLREYRRDVRRFLAGIRTELPSLPKHYFDEHTEGVLSGLSERLLCDRSQTCFDDLSRGLDLVSPPSEWLAPAARLFANWLRCVADGDLPRDADPIPTGAHPQPAGESAEATLLR